MGPLSGVKVIEMAGLAPAPYCGMLLADFGAEVTVVDRVSAAGGGPAIPAAGNPFYRGKRTVGLDLKRAEGVAVVQRMMAAYDVLIEPFRPGVMEKFGLGPDVALDLNPGIIYARLTGWGQSGPYAGMAGHDINYIGLSGALSLFRRKGEKPLAPCNLLGDFAGGGMLCAMGILLALVEKSRTGKGQTVDAAMVDGASNLATFFYGLYGNGLFSLDIGTNTLDSGAPFYETYETADGKYMAVGAIEAKFYQELLKGLGLDPSTLPEQNDTRKWPEMKKRFAEVFKTKTREEWASVFDGKDACATPILDLDEVRDHPHNQARQVFTELEGVTQPGPAPRLSESPGAAHGPGRTETGIAAEILRELNYPQEEADALLKEGIVE
jgi:alpha-methylacyl-CoA racemase